MKGQEAHLGKAGAKLLKSGIFTVLQLVNKLYIRLVV